MLAWLKGRLRGRTASKWCYYGTTRNKARRILRDGLLMRRLPGGKTRVFQLASDAALHGVVVLELEVTIPYDDWHITSPYKAGRAWQLESLPPEKVSLFEKEIT